MKVVLSPEALEDLKDIARWIARDNPERAVSFAAQLRTKCAELGRYPKRFPAVRQSPTGEIRKRAYRDYLIFYRIAEARVDVLRIAHGKRDWSTFFGER